MDIVGVVVVVVILAVIIIAALNWPAFKKILKVGSVKVEETANNLEKSNALGMYEAKVEEAAATVKNGKIRIAELKMELGTLESELTSRTNEQRILETRIESTNNDTQALKMSGELSSILDRIGKLTDRIAKTRASYQKNLDSVEDAKRRIVDLRETAKDLGMSLRVSKTEKDLAVMTSSLTDKFESHDLNKHRVEVERQIGFNEAMAQVEIDLSPADDYEKSNKDLKARQLLDRLREKGKSGLTAN